MVFSLFSCLILSGERYHRIIIEWLNSFTSVCLFSRSKTPIIMYHGPKNQHLSFLFSKLRTSSLANFCDCKSCVRLVHFATVKSSRSQPRLPTTQPPSSSPFLLFLFRLGYLRDSPSTPANKGGGRVRTEEEASSCWVDTAGVIVSAAMETAPPLPPFLEGGARKEEGGDEKKRK